MHTDQQEEEEEVDDLQRELVSHIEFCTDDMLWKRIA